MQLPSCFICISISSDGMSDEADLGGLGAVMNDPEILEALQDPDVQKAFAVRFFFS